MKEIKPKVYVKWMDHYSHWNDWADIKDVQKHREDPACETLGFLVYEDENEVRISPTIDTENHCRHVMCILKKLIVERVEFDI